MKIRRHLAHASVAIIAASAGLSVWSGLASAGSGSQPDGSTRVVLTQTGGSGHDKGGCNGDSGGPADGSVPAPARTSSV